MRGVLIGLVLATMALIFMMMPPLPAPAWAQDVEVEVTAVTEQSYKFSLDIGPGFLAALDDTADATGVEAYLAGAWHPNSRVAVGVRANARTTPGVEGVGKITGDFWGFVRSYVTGAGADGGLKTYVELSVSTDRTIAFRGGAELGLTEGLATFATLDGRKLEEEDAHDLLGMTAGMRMLF